jgi:hypothetical protein
MRIERCGALPSGVTGDNGKARRGATGLKRKKQKE